MPFNTLLLTGCFLPGKTSFTEDGVQLSLEPESGETVLFFSIDDQSNPNCKFRQILGIKKDSKICDLIVFYAKGNERIICFVELKGSKLGTAVEQVTNTYKHFRECLKSLNQNFIAKAYIKIEGSVLQETARYKKELSDVFKENNYDISRDSNLGNFLRGKGSQFKRKGKRK